MKKLLVIVLVAAAAILITQRYLRPGEFLAELGIEEAYDTYEEMVARGLPKGRFARVDLNSYGDTIEVRCFTRGRPGDLNLFQPYVDRVLRLTEKLRSRYQVAILFFDGYSAGDGTAVGTGKLLKQAILGNSSVTWQ
ncbi:MAG: hypothetical protein ACM3XS_04465 [Bacteroidota bacterium]